MFAQGDFSLPMFIHDTVPPGVEAMKNLKDQITYTAEKTAKGAQVRIATRPPGDSDCYRRRGLLPATLRNPLQQVVG